MTEPVVAIIPARISNPCAGKHGRGSIALVFDPAEPYAVTMVIPRAGMPDAVWHFTRELLAAGMDRESGIGDVSIHPGNPAHGDDLGIVITGGDTQALIELPRVKVTRFLRRTYAIVPSGSEHLFDTSVDDVIAKILNDAP